MGGGGVVFTGEVLILFLKLELASFWLQSWLQKVEVKASHFRNAQRRGLIFKKLPLSVVVFCRVQH